MKKGCSIFVFQSVPSLTRGGHGNFGVSKFSRPGKLAEHVEVKPSLSEVKLPLLGTLVPNKECDQSF